MVSYVVAHGWYDSNQPQVVVPQGMTLSFLADVDLAAVHHIQVAQLIAGGVAAATTYQAGEPLPNYQFSQFEDEFVARLYALNLHGLDLWIVGPVAAFALCTDVGGACTANAHVCTDGLLGIAQKQQVTHLHFLSCRVDDAPGHGAWGSDVNLHDGAADTGTWDRDLIAWTTGFMALDFAAQRSAWESLEYEDQAVRTADVEVADWSKVYEAVKAFEAGEATFVPYFASMSGAMKERLLREHPDVAASVRANLGPETLAQYSQYAGWFLDQPYDYQTEEWDGLEPEVRQTLLLDARVGDWAQAHSSRMYVPYMSGDQFRSYCANLTAGARDLLLADPDAQAKFVAP